MTPIDACGIPAGRDRLGQKDIAVLRLRKLVGTICVIAAFAAVLGVSDDRTAAAQAPAEEAPVANPTVWSPPIRTQATGVEPDPDAEIEISASEAGLVQISCPAGVLDVAGSTQPFPQVPCETANLVITSEASTSLLASFEEVAVESIRIEGNVAEDAGLVITGSVEAPSFSAGGGAIVVDGSLTTDVAALIAGTSVVVMEGSNITAPGGRLIIDAGPVGFVQQSGATIDVANTDADGGEIVVTGGNISMSGVMRSSGQQGAISLLSSIDDGLTLVSGKSASTHHG